MKAVTTVALDAMGGDHGPSVVVPAAVNALKRHDGLHLILVGSSDRLKDELQRLGVEETEWLSVVHASEVVEMDEAPAQALRMKKDSSMRVAINLVKEGRADACVSAGNTGALMATARFVLRTLTGIDRPAICAKLPGLLNDTRVLDLGANVDSKAEHLLQFAIMGSELARALDELTAPRVGLLNVGEEAIKGNEQVREAAILLSRSGLNYVGFVEGDDIYTGEVDVVVCDGFIGNVALKSSEGVAKLIREFMRREFFRNGLTKLAGLVALPVLRRLRRRIDPRRYNGASLLGLSGIVIKSHGSADVLAFGGAVDVAILEVEKNVPSLIRKQVEATLVKREAV